MPPRTLPIEPLTAAAFEPFGEVIEAAGAAERIAINEGFSERFHALARVDLGDAADGPAQALINIFRSKPRQLPMYLRMLERHPLGSQSFTPLAPGTFLVVVAPGAPDQPAPDLAGLRCFLAAAGQGVNYARGTWHHPLLSLHAVSDFLVVDRAGPGLNLQEFALAPESVWIPALD
ncbi:MAG: ureidoglycolate hydrolase [Polaromonas sp.]|nr:ureidoglycolate hydrolase [Polaromonas sp.]